MVVFAARGKPGLVTLATRDVRVAAQRSRVSVSPSRARARHPSRTTSRHTQQEPFNNQTGKRAGPAHPCIAGRYNDGLCLREGGRRDSVPAELATEN